MALKYIQEYAGKVGEKRKLWRSQLVPKSPAECGRPYGLEIEGNAKNDAKASSTLPLVDGCIRSALRPRAGVQSLANTQTETSCDCDDDQEDQHLYQGSLLAAHADPPSAARLLSLQLLLPHLQLVASRPCGIDIRCALLLQQACLALARLGLLLGQGLCLEVVVEGRVDDGDVLFRFGAL